MGVRRPAIYPVRYVRAVLRAHVEETGTTPVDRQ